MIEYMKTNGMETYTTIEMGYKIGRKSWISVGQS